MLVDYAGDDEEEDEEKGGREGGEAASAGRLMPLVLQAGEVGQSSEEEQSEHEEEEEECVGPALPLGAAPPKSRVLPVSLTASAYEEEEEGEDGTDGEDDTAGESAATATLLPAPDFTGWHPEGGGAPARPTAPLVSARGDRKRKAAGPSHISSGPRPSVTRYDALRAAAQAELDHEINERTKNHGFSSAYDSVFHASRDEDEDDGRRTKVTRKGKVRTMSKKEAAAEDALLASLR
mmetsp:Transcript_4364/g.13187  ORF Transcript_4364/g.13187 Transcript_4364/m.13187 type:complete len:236 (+) Transcript_4364:91-798(+)|eukprot:scaffold300850_cov27-Tisochrysis_lutea.AAC.1